MSLAVVTCFYNFAGFSRIQQNLLRYLRQMKSAGIPVFGAEAILPGATPATAGLPNWRFVEVDPVNQTMWQKESLINLAAEQVPPSYGVISWQDADVFFTNSDWARDTEKALETRGVVQLFEHAVWTNARGEADLVRTSCAKTPLDDSWNSHPGFAWAMRRDLWDASHGLYPWAAHGGADSLMAVAFSHTQPPRNLMRHVGNNGELYQAWSEHYKDVSLGWVPGYCYHEWHGDRKDREYTARREVMSLVDVATHLKKASNGLLEWTDAAPREVIEWMAGHFQRRNEDG